MTRIAFLLLAISLGVATLLLATFFGNRTGPASHFHLRPDQNTILFAVTPWEEAREMKRAYRPLLDYLSQKTGKKFQLLVMEDYSTAIEHIVEGDIDIFVLPPVSYVLAKEKEPEIQYIATQVREQDGKQFATYKGYIVALKSKYDGWRLDDFLKNSHRYNFGFVTQKSSSGWAYPMALLKKKGVDPKRDFKQITIFENHPAVTDALVAGNVDLAATWEHNLEMAKRKHGDLFTLVETTALIPGIVWVASKKVPPPFVQKMTEVLLELNTLEMRKELLKETPDKGWQIVAESFYNEVKEVLKYVGSFE